MPNPTKEELFKATRSHVCKEQARQLIAKQTQEYQRRGGVVKEVPSHVNKTNFKHPYRVFLTEE